MYLLQYRATLQVERSSEIASFLEIFKESSWGGGNKDVPLRNTELLQNENPHNGGLHIVKWDFFWQLVKKKHYRELALSCSFLKTQSDFVKLWRKYFTIALQIVLLIDDLNQYKTKSWYIISRSPLLTTNIFCLSWGVTHLIMCRNILHQSYKLLDHVGIFIDT